MSSSPSDNSPPSLCSGRFLLALTHEGKRAPFALLLLGACAIVAAQNPKSSPTKPTPPQRVNELTLAGLRPGRDTATVALVRFKKWPFEKNIQDTQLSWHYPCFSGETLTLDVDGLGKVQVIRLTSGGEEVECEPVGRKTLLNGWQTGHGLRLRSPISKILQLYGPPDSKSPSSKAGQQLELWYYAFDWAGADVPQVMEVLCTKETIGTPGRVIEITLAAPSL